MRRNVVINLFIFICAIFASLLFFSKNTFADRFDTSETQTVRSLGMGNAGINSERGGLSVFYNPANIAAKSTRPVLQLFNFSLETNQGLISHTARGNINYTSLDAFYKSLKNDSNNFSGGRISLFPNITLRNLTLGVLYEQNRGAMVRATDDALYVKARDRFAPVAALSFRLFGGALRLGAKAEYLSVGEADQYIQTPEADTTMTWKKYTKAGGGIEKSAGATITIPMRYLPSFSFVARDIGGTSFSRSPLGVSGSAGTPTAREMTYDTSGAFTLLLASRLETKWEVDYRDVTNKNKGSQMQRIFAGTEFSFFDIFHLRAGYMHGYPTAGIGIGTSRTSINFAWYSDEIEARLRANRDQRFVFQYSSSFFGSQ